MSGIRARLGFRFSDLFLIGVVLDEIAIIQNSIVENGTAPSSSITYGVEATLDGIDGKTEWDVLSVNGPRSELLEVKSGAVSVADRKQFWKRIRSQVSATPGSLFSVGLVINSASPPSAEGAWRGLAEVVGKANATLVMPKSAPARVTDGDDLFNEALFWLCVADSEPAPTEEDPDGKKPLPAAVSMAIALGLLQSFKLIESDADTLEARIHTKLDQLMLGPDAPVVRQQIEGWLTKLACETQGVAHHFSASDVLNEVLLLKKFLEHPEAQVRLWRRLRNEITGLTLARLDSIQSGSRISRVSLETCQPGLADLVSTGVYDSAIVIGDAGQGKSLLIRDLSEKLATSFPNGTLVQVVVSADDLVDSSNGNVLADFGNTLLMGSSLAALKGQRLALIVDGLDQVSSSVRFGLAKELKKAAFRNAVQIFITCRGPDWEATPQVRGELSSFRVFSLSAWPSSFIEGLLRNAKLTVNGPALKNLLGNPLYLDLLLRTFGVGEVVPDGLQTRHGLLKAFWDAQVLFFDPPSKIHSALAKLANAVSSGGSELGTTVLDAAGSAEISHLASVGVIARSSNSKSASFRHPLLRDFVISQWALEKGVGSFRELQSIQSPIIRFGATRALVEALVESAASPYSSSVRLPEVAKILQPLEVRDLGEVFGTLQVVESMDPQLWADGLTPEFGKCVLDSASHARNVDWLRLMATWPSDAHWIDRQSWLGPDSLECLVKFIESLKADRAVATSFDALVVVSKRMLVWSGAKKFEEKFRDYEGYLVEKIVTAVTDITPDVGLLDYIDSNFVRTFGHWRLRLLASLAVIAEKNANDNPLLARIRAIFESMSGLVRVGAHYRFPPDSESDMLDSHFIVEWSFLGSMKGSGGGLFQVAPAAMLPIAFGLIEAYWFVEEEKRIKRNAEMRERLLKGTPDEVQTARYFPDEQLPSGKLIDDDSPNGRFWRNRNTHPEALTQLLNAMEDVIRRKIEDEPNRFLTEWLPMFRDCRSATVWTQILDLLTKNIHRGSDWIEALVSLLCGEHLFEVDDTYSWVEYVAQKIWSDLDDKQKARIIAAISSYRPGPLFRETAAPALAHFLSLFPEGSITIGADQASFVLELRSKKFDSLLFNPEHSEEFRFVHISRAKSDDFEPTNPDASGIEREIAQARRNAAALLKAAVPDKSEISNLIVKIISVLSNAPAVENTGADGSGLVLLADLFDGFRKEPSESTSVDSSSAGLPVFLADLVKLIGESLTKYRASSLTQGATVSRDNDIPIRETEMGIMRLLCGVSCLPPVATDASLSKVVCEAFVQILQGSEIILQNEILAHSIGTWLFQVRSFLVAYRNGILTSPRHPSLVIRGMSSIWYFPEADRESIFRSLFQLVDGSEEREIAQNLGEFLGQSACCEVKDGCLWAGPLIDEILLGGSSLPLISDLGSKSRFLQSLAFGLKDGAKQAFLRVDLAEPYARWMSDIRRQLGPIYQSPNGAACPVWLYALHWIGEVRPKSVEQKSVLSQWWRAMKPRVLGAVATATSGEAAYIFSALYVNSRTNEEPTGVLFLSSPEDVIEICESFVQRVVCEPSMLVQRPGVAEMSWSYVLDADVSKALRDCYVHGRPTGGVLDRLSRLLEVLSKPPFELEKIKVLLRDVRNDQK